MKAKNQNFSVPIIFLNYPSDSICRVKISINNFQKFKKGDIIDVDYTCLRIIPEFVFNYFILKDNTNIAANLFEDDRDKLNAEEFYDYMEYNIIESNKDKSISEDSLNEKNNIEKKDIIKDISLEKDKDIT